MPIISVSGKIGSGKDTVGEIIRYLIAKHTGKRDPRIGFSQDIHYTESGWEIKKFADKLKDITCLLLNCTREELEDREFKETPLGPEWENIFYLTNNGRRVLLEGNIPLNDTERFYQREQLTPRILLQRLGTEAGREIIHPNIWVNALFSDYKNRVLSEGGDRIASDGGYYTQPSYKEDSKWIITDMRFDNEIEAVKKRNSITIKIERDTELRYPKLWKDYQESNEESWDDYLLSKGLTNTVYHPSEISLDKRDDFDYVIKNNGSLEELVQKVENVLINARIINA